MGYHVKHLGEYQHHLVAKLCVCLFPCVTHLSEFMKKQKTMSTHILAHTRGQSNGLENHAVIIIFFFYFFFMDPFEESVRFANFEVNLSNLVYLSVTV